MKHLQILLCGIFLILPFLLNGCAQTVQDIPLPTTQYPGKDNVRIVVSRPADDVDCGWLFVYDDGKQIGSLACGGTLVWDRPVGKITLSARNMFGRYSPYILQATTNKTYNLYISYLHYRTAKTFSSDVYPSASDKGGYAKTPAKKESAQTNTNLITKVEGTAQIEKWGLIIGITNYKDTRIPGLRYAATDAQGFYDWCISQEGGRYSPSRMKLLLNHEATGKNIRNALFVWLKQALEEDMVTIYFAGHGSPASPDSSTNLFLLPYDADYKDIATTGFPMWDIETALSRFVKAKKVIVIADACHSGGIGHDFDIARRGNRGLKVNSINTELQRLSRIGPGICILSASDDKQLSQESQKWGGGHGVFTFFLLKGLAGEADYNKDDRVTLGELIPYLSEEVRRETRNSQAPTVAGKFDPALAIGK